MPLRAVTLAGLALGAALGFAVSYLPSVEAARNSSGTYSLPAGNPVVTGTAVSSTWANTTLTDIRTEITSSLDRSGRGAMLAPLQCSVGSVSAPGLTFSGDTNTGLYRVGADNPAMAAGGVKAQEWTATASTIPVALTCSAGATVAAGLTVTNSTGTGVTSTGGTNSGNGGNFLGGAGVGVYALGGANSGSGILAVGGDGGPGITAVAGAGANAGIFTGAGGGYGVVGTGGTTGQGGQFAAGTAATAAVRQTALSVTNGDIGLNGVANPNSNVALLNRLSPLAIPKAFGTIAIGSGTPTVTAGMNIASVACATKQVTITLAQALGSASAGVCLVDIVYGTAATKDQCVQTGAGTFVVNQYIAASETDLCAVGSDFKFVIFGAQ